MTSRNLCLVGMMGGVKTTVAAVLTERLGRRVADTDQEIRRWTERAIPELLRRANGSRCRGLRMSVSQAARRWMQGPTGIGQVPVPRKR